MTHDMFDIAVAGHICFDIIPQFLDSGATDFSQIMTPGKLVNVGPVATSTGGPVSNTGIGMHILGMKVHFMTKVGDDAFGAAIIERLAKLTSTAGVKVEKSAHTSYTVALAPPRIDRVFLHHPGTNDTFASSDVNWDLVAKVRHFHLGYPPLMKGLYGNEGRELTDIFRRAKEAGATTSMDMSLPDPNSESGRAPWKKILQNTLPYVDMYLPSIEESLFMLDRERFLKMKAAHGGKELIPFITPDDYTAISDSFIEMGSKIVALKSGPHGIYMHSADKSRFKTMGRAQPKDADNWSDRELWCPAIHVHPIASATGSGDSAIAGLLSAFLRGESIERTLKYANTVGGLNLTRLDAITGLKNWEDTTALLDDPQQRVERFDLKDPAWRWNDGLKMWIKR